MRRAIQIVSLASLVTLVACGHEQIRLGYVSDLPEYFSVTCRFGNDLHSVAELNNAILITGHVDTTTEFPPLHMAAIADRKSVV